MRQGDYKAATVAPPYGDGQWRLFDVVKDPGETNDLAATKPELLAKLQEAWDEYADGVGVILTE
jgi:arylsulfatase